jgi:F-type H+-transporting ATPase subunit alpha
LKEKLFDSIPLDQVKTAEAELHNAELELPLDVKARLVSPEKLRDEDRQTVVGIAKKSLARFQSKPAPSPSTSGHQA